MIIGASAQIPIINEPINEEKIVAKTLKLAGIPASVKIIGLTIII